MATTRNRDGTKSHATDAKVCATCDRSFRARRRYGTECPTRFCSRGCYISKPEPPHNHLPVGTKRTLDDGYIIVKVADTGRWQSDWRHEHVLIAEKALGRSLKEGEVVHHVNGDKAENENSNLLICSAGYHRWLHNHMAHLYQREHFGTR